jgi:hypothetical protein
LFPRCGFLQRNEPKTEVKDDSIVPYQQTRDLAHLLHAQFIPLETGATFWQVMDLKNSLWFLENYKTCSIVPCNTGECKKTIPIEELFFSKLRENG